MDSIAGGGVYLRRKVKYPCYKQVEKTGESIVSGKIRINNVARGAIGQERLYYRNSKR